MNIHNQVEHFSLIPRLGYWTYDKDLDKFHWSERTCKLLGWPEKHSSPTLKEFIEIVHEKDREEIIEAVKQLYKQSSDGYGHEVRVKVSTNPIHYNWFHVIGKAHENLIFGVIIDINKRKIIEKKNAQLQKQLLAFAKQAGMAEVAVSVIHNIGNVLNSATTSISILEDKMQKTSCKKFLDLIPLLKEHQSSLQTYLTQDPRGKKIPEYLIALGDAISAEGQVIVKEIDDIAKCINHIKDIICTQDCVSNICAIKESFVLLEILDTTIQFFENIIKKHNITVTKNYNDNVSISLDKSKLMQILVNLIKNAIDTVILNKEQPNKKINITVNKQSNIFIAIIIEDNGLGIAKENINKIFSFGFTTKTDGHGFGLHNSAIKAKELGGSLQAKNNDIEGGATFTLTLPLNLENNPKSTETKHDEQK